MKIYDINVTKIDGTEISMRDFENKVLLIVNTASKWGFTKQFEELEVLFEKYRDEDFVVLGFPCNQFNNQDPNSNEEILNFCKSTFNVSFPMFAKIEVNGENTHPLYKFLKAEKSGLFGDGIKWNFTKFLVDKKGKVVERFAPTTNPLKIEDKIKELLK